MLITQELLRMIQAGKDAARDEDHNRRHKFEVVDGGFPSTADEVQQAIRKYCGGDAA